jgi:Arc/MetJ-type ribon-helix-helix transcriptional regulator
MTQLVTRVDDSLAASIDELVKDGVVASRSDAVRRGLTVLIEQSRRARTAMDIVSGYRDQPQTDEELAWAEDAGVRMINEEPW